MIIESDKDRIILPFKKIIFCFVCYFLMIIITFLKGSKNMKSIINIEVCSMSYWFINLLYFPITILITYFISKLIYEEFKYRSEIGYAYHETDLRWDKEMLINIPIKSSIAGILSGMLGVGGGFVLGPLLLDLGIHPLVSTATSNMLVVLISLSTTSQYVLQGSLNYNYGMFLMFFSILGSLTGTYFIFKLVEKTKRNSILIFVLGFVMALSSVSIPFHSFKNITKFQDLNYYGLLTFKSPC